jgi:hypothetical protein
VLLFLIYSPHSDLLKLGHSQSADGYILLLKVGNTGGSLILGIIAAESLFSVFIHCLLSFESFNYHYPAEVCVLYWTLGNLTSCINRVLVHQRFCPNETK